MLDYARQVTAIPFDPTTPEQRENPFDVLEFARREEPVFFAPALGLWVVTRHDDVLALIRRGMRLWAELPVRDMVLRSEELFQAGLEQHAGIVGDYEIWPGRRLVDTTPAERLTTADAGGPA